MKRILFFALAAIIAVMAMAQDAKPHLQFKGIPIQGSISAFCQKLQNKGFTPLRSTDKNVRIFKGDFTGRKSTVGVVATEDGKNVFSVVVFFDETEEWNTLVSTYDHYKDLYTTKYGQPAECVEDNPGLESSHVTNTGLMSEVYQGRVTWTSQYVAEGGKIQLSIEKGSGIYTGFVMIKYQDSQNIEQKRQNDLDDI